MVLCSPLGVKLISRSSGGPLHRSGSFWHPGRHVNRRQVDSCTVMAGVNIIYPVPVKRWQTAYRA